jgi:hypothetical protein
MIFLLFFNFNRSNMRIYLVFSRGQAFSFPPLLFLSSYSDLSLLSFFYPPPPSLVFFSPLLFRPSFLPAISYVSIIKIKIVSFFAIAMWSISLFQFDQASLYCGICLMLSIVLIASSSVLREPAFALLRQRKCLSAAHWWVCSFSHTQAMRKGSPHIENFRCLS